MGTTGRRNGTLNALYLGGSVQGGTKLTYLTVNSFTISGSTIDVSSKDDAGWKTTLDGQQTFSFNCSAQYAEDAAYGFSELFALKSARTSVLVKVKTAVTGDNIYSGTCRITNLAMTDEVEGSSNFSVDFEGTGAASETVTT